MDEYVILKENDVMKKFELTTETKIIHGIKLFRIKALTSFGNVKEGELGGFVEKEENLAQTGNAQVFDNACVFGNATVFNNANVFGNSKVYDYACVFSNAKVYDNARVFGIADICATAEIYGDAIVSDNAWISGNAKVPNEADYICIKGLGSINRYTTFYKTKDNIEVNCGCFHGTLEEFTKKVIETHKDTKFAKEYLASVEMVKIHFDIQNDNNKNDI